MVVDLPILHKTLNSIPSTDKRGGEKRERDIETEERETVRDRERERENTFQKTYLFLLFEAT